METPCCCSPSLATKGQGYVLLWLIFTWLWALGACSPETSDTIWPSTTAWTTSPAPSPQLQPASPVPEVTTSFQPLASDPSPTSLSESTVNVQGGISPTSVSSPPHSDGDVSSTQTHVDVLLSEPLQSSSFVSPSVSLYPTPAVSLGSSDFGGSFTTGGWEQTAHAGVGDSSSSTPLIVSSTLFVDSVAVSVRRDPTVGLDDSGSFISHVQTSTQGDLGTGTAALPETESNAFVVVTSASTFTLGSSEESVFPTSRREIEVTSSAASQASSLTGMLVMNSTQTSTVFQPSAGETTSSLLNSTPEVSSLGPSGGNGSCTEKDTGCVEYRGDEDEEEERRIKIIIGAVCGAILLVVILGVFLGCILKRRGKMPSGSKIDLSSYWDDSVTLSYINGHVDIPKDSADEMISLDNDSFLNSLDSMSFTNTWTSDTSKHTNF